MRVVIVTGVFPRTSNPSGGIYVTKRVQQLLRAGIEVHILVPRHYQSRPRRFVGRVVRRILGKGAPAYRLKADAAETTVSEGISYEGLPIRKGLFAFGERASERALRNHLRTMEFDILHAHRAYPEGYWASRVGDQLHKPVVITAHGSDIHTVPFKSRRSRTCVQRALENATRCIFVSAALMEKAKSVGFSARNAVVISNGYDPSLFYPREASKHSQTAKTVGFVGNLIQVKRADEFSGLFRAIEHRLPDARYVVVGDGQLRQKLQTELSDFPVVFHGYVEHTLVPNIMKQFDVMILPSREEGWPCVVKEAQAMGVPVVGSRVGGIPDAIGSGGVAVPAGPRFTEDFADAVVDILMHPPLLESVVAAAKGYTWESVVRQEIAVYREALAHFDARKHIAERK